jgi:hypothetical protein
MIVKPLAVPRQALCVSSGQAFGGAASGAMRIKRPSLWRCRVRRYAYQAAKPLAVPRQALCASSGRIYQNIRGAQTSGIPGKAGFSHPPICLNICMQPIKGVLIGRGNLAGQQAAFAAAGLEITDVLAPGAPIPASGAGFAAISLPPGDARKTALLALKGGLNVVCEPPFCLSITEFETLREAAEKSGKTIFPLQPWERSPALRGLEKALDRGLTGETDYASIKACFSGGIHSGSAPLWQIFSILLSSVRRPPAAIEARMPEVGPAAFHVHFGGADGFAHVSGGAARPSLRLTVSGSKGSVETDGRLLLLDVAGQKTEVIEFDGELTPGHSREEWLTSELLDFRAETEGSKPRGTGLRNSRYCVKLLRSAPYSASVRSAAVPL